jgi:flagellar basal-body rod protein FlgF
MDRGLYIAASGMLAEQLRQDLLANDLANVNTPGYKPDRAAQASFGDVLLENTASGAIVGPMSMGTGIAAVDTDTRQGALRQTGEPMDVAIEGDAYFEVQTPAGVRYSRGGRLLVDAQGRLATTAGFPLLDAAGNPLMVGKEQGVQIGADGTVSVDGKTVGQLALVGLTGIAKQGDSVLAGTPAALAAPAAVRQGMLEASGVDAGRVMVNMLISMRSFEASQRVLRAIDDTLGRAVNSVGSVGG